LTNAVMIGRTADSLETMRSTISVTISTISMTISIEWLGRSLAMMVDVEPIIIMRRSSGVVSVSMSWSNCRNMDGSRTTITIERLGRSLAVVVNSNTVVAVRAAHCLETGATTIPVISIEWLGRSLAMMVNSNTVVAVRATHCLETGSMTISVVSISIERLSFSLANVVTIAMTVVSMMTS